MEILMIITVVVADVIAIYCLSLSTIECSPLAEVFFCLVLPALIIKLLKRIRKKRLPTVCPKCKKSFSLKRIESVVIGRENIAVLVETQDRDRQGNILRYNQQYIPGTRTTHQDKLKCRYCGYILYRNRLEDRKSI